MRFSARSDLWGYKERLGVFWVTDSSNAPTPHAWPDVAGGLLRIVPKIKDFMEAAIPAYQEHPRDIARRTNVYAYRDYIAKVRMAVFPYWSH